jgi:hypothetical protein
MEQRRCHDEAVSVSAKQWYFFGNGNNANDVVAGFERAGGNGWAANGGAVGKDWRTAAEVRSSQSPDATMRR